MKRTNWIALVLLPLAAFTAGCHHDDDDREQKKIALNIPKDPPKRPQGSTALTVKPGATPFDKTDVSNYFKTHNLPMNYTTTNDFTVDTLEFLTNAELATRLNGANAGLAETARIGFATLVGSFVFTGPPNAKAARFSRAYAAFDAKTGNLLMIGTLDQNERKPQ
ncbi:MAG TPA: hypothetical protein VII25_12730 [Candidatus Acidoferrum sp.]|jgi:hypothetical protein